MIGKKFVFAAILGMALSLAGAVQAASSKSVRPAPMPPPPQQDNFFDAIVNGIGQAFSPDNGFWQGQGADQTGGLYPEDVPRSRVVPWEFHRQTVNYTSNEKPGTIIIDPRAHFLYFVLGNGQAIRYGVGVGRTGFGWHGTVHVGAKQEWPGWTPPKEMIVREAKRGHKLPAFMPGGVGNPLGARAMYLHNGTGDTGFRIHGTSEPWTIGLNVSSGCIRLINDDVSDLYSRVSIGAKVIVL
jgi:lipoprotein-anchoring transpeptidase ErfK/SrfK